MNPPLAPRVSIIIPAYNAGRYIGATLESVFQQTRQDYEIIVVDDGSTDDTRNLVERLNGRVRYVFQANEGPSAARNRGIQMAQGELICFLDSDDSWMPGKLQQQIEYMDGHREVALIFADGEEYDDGGVVCASLLSKSRYYAELRQGGILRDGFQKLLLENFIPTSTVMVRRACFEKAGLFDHSMKGPEDRDMWSRIAAHFEIACMPQLLGRKRVVASSVSRNVETTLRSRIILWQKARRLFPGLTSEQTVNALLAPTYLDLAFLLLEKNATREARDAALKGVAIARKPRQWLLGTALLAFSFTGSRGAQAALKLKRTLFPPVA